MDCMASLALFARGRDVWNAWAADMVARGRAIVAAGDWGWSFDSRLDASPTNKVTADYLHDAAALFSYHQFNDAPDFSGFVFPGYAGFIATKFPHGARFCGTRFGDGVGFNFARFGAAVAFDGAEFCSRGDFFRTEFLGEVSFKEARFIRGEFEPSHNARAEFMYTKFAEPVSFENMRCGDAVFSDTQFEKAVDFTGAAIADMFFIGGATFRGPVSVRGTRFARAVDWTDATLSIPPNT